MSDKNPLYEIGDLLTELEEKNLNLITGLITDIVYDKEYNQYNYCIKWSDMKIETVVNESILHWRVQNRIWHYYGVVK